VIVKLYQGVERDQAGPLARYSVAQAKQARGYGCTVGGYGWLYAGIPADRQVAEFLDTGVKAGLHISERNPLWLDCEDYADAQGHVSYPSLETIEQAVDACVRMSIPCGIYTAAWWWIPRTGNNEGFSGLPLWDAIYDGNPNLIAPKFGGWVEMAGHQWTSTPIDRSVFRARFAAA
jgi:hypothetical protein